jgi:MFS family permease
MAVKDHRKGGLYAWYTIGLLSMAYGLSMMDRLMPSLLIEPIRQDLDISDLQVSLLTGFAFAMFYATAAIPISGLADRGSRKRIILLGVGLWGAMTALCGLTTNFWQFFAARMGVGVGEAALTPSAYAMTNELFPPAQRSRAAGVFVLGSAVGGGLGLMVGSWLIALFKRLGPVHIPGIGTPPPWGLVLITVGLVTIAATAPLATIADVRHKAASPGDASLASVCRQLWRRRAGFGPLFLGVPLVSMASYGVQAWLPALFMRRFHWSVERAGVEIGFVSLVASIFGILAGVWMADRWRSSGRSDAPLTLLAWSFLISAPLFIALPYAPSGLTALWLFAAISVITGPLGALAPAALQAITENAGRAQVAALFLLVTNLIGIGLGPTSVAWVSETFFTGPGAVAPAVAWVGCQAFALSGTIMLLGRNAFRRLAVELETGSKGDAPPPASAGL